MRIGKTNLAPDSIALAALLLVAAVLVAGDFRVVLANSSADDSPVLFGRFFADPDRFQRDLLATYGNIYGLGTAVHWLPALLHRLGRFPLEVSAYIITLLQTILLGLAIYNLTRIATGDAWKAWLSACFALAAEVYAWNLANYSSQMHSPYAGHFVLPFVIFGLTAWTQARTRAAALWLSAAALIHPTLTLVTIGLLIGRAAWRGFGPVHRREALWLALPAVLSCAPPLLIQQRFGGELAGSIVADLMRGNMHMNPFPLARIYTTVLPTLAAFLLLVALGARRSQADAGYRALAIDTVIYTALLGIIHFIAAQMRIAIVMTFVPLRFSTVMIAFTLPLAIAYLADALTSGGLVRRWASALLLIVPPLAGMGALTGAAAACVLGEVRKRENRGGENRAGEQHDGAHWDLSVQRHRLIAAVFFSWLGLILIAFWLRGLSGETRALLLAIALPGSRIDPSTFTLAAVVAGLIAWLALRDSRMRSGVSQAAARPAVRGVAQFTLAAVLAGLLLVNDARKGARTLDGELHDLYAAQEWARRNTPVDALFLLEPNIAWRVGADRPVIEATAPPLHVYSRSQDAYDRIQARMSLQKMRPWTQEAGVLEFARAFGGDYFVRYAERPPLFETVYRNDTYAIYRLPTAAVQPAQ